MNFKFKLTIYFLILCNFTSFSQKYIEWNEALLSVLNDVVSWVIKTSNEGITSTSLTLGDESSFITDNSEEFSFIVNGKAFDGTNHWQFIDFVEIADSLQGKGATVRLRDTSDASLKIQVELSYMLYPNSAGIRKYMKIINTGDDTIKLESVDIEKLHADFTFQEVYGKYGRERQVIPYTGNWHDMLVIAHDNNSSKGVLLGNESPGVLKRTNVQDNSFAIGLTHASQSYTFRKYISPGESWTSPVVFILPYANASDPQTILNGQLSDFIRNHLGARIVKHEKSVLTYNTWNPFDSYINKTLLEYYYQGSARFCCITEGHRAWKYPA